MFLSGMKSWTMLDIKSFYANALKVSQKCINSTILQMLSLIWMCLFFFFVFFEAHEIEEMRKVRYFHHYDETHLHLQVFIFYSSTCLCCVWFKWQATLLHNLKRIPPSGFSFLPIKAGQSAPGQNMRERNE